MTERFFSGESDDQGKEIYSFGELILPFEQGFTERDDWRFSNDTTASVFSPAFKFLDQNFQGFGRVEIEEDFSETSGELKINGVIYPVLSHHLRVVMQHLVPIVEQPTVVCSMKIGSLWYESRAEVHYDEDYSFFDSWQEPRTREPRTPKLAQFEEIPNLALVFIKNK